MAISSERQDIPQACTVLVVGGGPGGSYAATVLAREGVDVILLEADAFPRYHIGESMLPAMRHLLRFIDLDSTFDAHGFTKKVGAAFKLNATHREGYTDFLAAGGPENYVWNVVRSEADEILFQHSKKNGAKAFDGVKVNSVQFENDDDPTIARPVSAKYTHKSDASNGVVTFDYIVDASGRAGLLSTKYLKNRKYNQGLKNVASWGYWKGTGSYGIGTPRENTPFFEALADGSGWAWLIPLHTGASIGVVMNEDLATKKKHLHCPPLSAQEFYLDQLKHAPTLFSLIGSGSQLTAADGKPEIRSASDYSYSSKSYGSTGLRIVGDAGAFIDPFFSSGVHLALTGGLSAALTICAALRGDCSEADAARWHSDKVGANYTWFLMVVLGAYKQIRAQEEPVLSDVDEDNFDRAFAFLRPVIQGSMELDGHRSQDELVKTLNFCAAVFNSTQPETRETVLKKMNRDAAISSLEGHEPPEVEHDELHAEEEQRVREYLNARVLLRTEDTLNLSNFATDVVGEYHPRLEHGKLGLACENVEQSNA